MVKKPFQPPQSRCLSLCLLTKTIKFCFTIVIVVIAFVTVLSLGSWWTLFPVIQFSSGDNNLTASSEAELIQLLIRNSTVAPTQGTSAEVTTTLRADGATTVGPSPPPSMVTRLSSPSTRTDSNTSAATTFASLTTTAMKNATTLPPLEDCGAKFYKSRVWPDPGPPYQCVGVPGRLGNAMFTYASSLGVAAIDNRTIVVNSDNELLNHFKLRALVNCGNRLCNNRKGKHEAKGCCIFHPDLLAPEPSAPELGVGLYLQSWRYFEHVQSELKRHFTPYGSTAEKVDRVKKQIRHEMANLTKEEVTYVGLHVRHGDILRNKNFIEHGYLAATEGYFHRAMMWFVSRYPKVVFLVSSDDEEFTRSKILANCTGSWPVKASAAQNVTVWPGLRGSETTQADSNSTAGRNSSTGSGSLPPTLINNATTPKTGDRGLDADTLVPAVCRYLTSDQPVVDLLVLASCGHVIMSTGTYGWWAGWLGGGTVIYYRHPVREGSDLAKHTNLTDHFPLRWIPMD